MDELDETIKIVQTNPARFQLDHRQISERKRFVADARRTVTEMRSSVNSNAGDKAARDALLATKKSSKTDAYGRTEGDYKVSNQRFVEREKEQQQQFMEQQDHQMEDVAVTVSNLKEVARVMGDELEDQTRYITSCHDFT